MKKILIAFLASLCFSCLVAAACNDEPNYYQFTYEQVDGITYISHTPGLDDMTEGGVEVKEGVEISFSLSVDQNKVIGEPIVMLNGEELVPDENNVYSFVMKGDVNLEINNVSVIHQYEVTFDTSEYRVKFSSEDGDAESGFSVSAGEKISFTVDVSPYYINSYDVLANTTIVEPDENGVYSVVVTNNTNISVYGLELDEPFLYREDGGLGTEASPYKISRPIDLYCMADIVGDSFWASRQFYAAYYELTNDIDMCGEQLFIIGDATSDGTYMSFFGGHFNGNGYTISNFYIDDTIIEQSAYTTVFMPYIGLFGCVLATSNGPAEISNLNLDNFTINVDAAKYKQSCFVGAIVGQGVGVNITGCSATGKITVKSDEGYPSYVGGIAGAIQSAYSSDQLRFYSSVRSCESNVDVAAQSGSVYCAGGIVGYLISYEEKTPSFVMSSFSTGDVYGAMNAGGIVGIASSFSSVIDSYSTGYIEADCNLVISLGNEIYGHASAGGIVGYMDYASIIRNCFATGEVGAYSVNGPDYVHKDGICGFLVTDVSDYIDSFAPYIDNCYSANDNVVFNEDFIKNTLNWTTVEWIFNDGGYPLINYEESHIDYTITVVVGDGFADSGVVVTSLDVSDLYLPMSFWNMSAQGLPEYVTCGGLRSYGYYFDKELTLKVPYAFVPNGDITLYVGLADYSEVVGKYYLQTETEGSGAYIELFSDGTLLYRDAALNYTSTYKYDGNTIIIYDCPALAVTLEYEDGSGNSTYGVSYYTGMATLDNGVLSIINLIGEDSYVVLDSSYVYTSDSPLVAVKEIESFVYGGYYAEDGTEYVFNTDGTGVTIGASEEKFTYTVSDGVISIKGANFTKSGTVENGYVRTVGDISLNALDIFVGVWEKSASSHRIYEFDGKGGWTYTYFGYEDGIEYVILQSNGTYSVNAEGNEITLDNGVKVGYDSATGFLTIDSVSYYKQSSYVGTWRFSNNPEPIEITFYGIGTDGYGSAYVEYFDYGNYYLTYAVSETEGEEYLYLYYFDTQFGKLKYDAENNTLTGELYSSYRGFIRSDVTFCLYDDFKGVWISDDSNLELVEFNGLGNYNLAGNINHLAVKGNVKINGVSVGAYTLENATLTGSFVYNDTVYNIEFNEQTGLIEVSYDGNSVILEKRDNLYGLELIDENGNIYTFDGRGNVSSGGKLTVTSSEGSSVLNYKIETENYIVISINNVTAGSIAIDDAYTLTLNGVQYILSVRNDFTGKWHLGGTLDGYIEIGDIGASFTASGEYLGESVTFNYDAGGDYLYFTWEDSIMYVNATYSIKDGVKSYELIVSRDNGTSGDYTVCVPLGTRDSFYGEYVSNEGYYVIIDGLSNSNLNGTAIFYTSDDKVYITYKYTVNKFGFLTIIDGTDTLFIMTECEEGTEGAYIKDGVSYEFTEPDILYTIKVTDSDELEYVFDGVGTVICSNGYTYDYVIEEHDTLLFLIHMVFTDNEGNEYTAVFDYSGTQYVLTLTEKSE